MPALSTCPEAERANKLAERMGTSIPGSITEQMWALPILEAMEERLDRLTAAVLKMKD